MAPKRQALRDRRARGGQRGFTLLEVVVAFTIFALAFATVLQVTSGSVRNTARSREFTEAALWAQSRMASIGIDEPLQEGSRRGEFNDRYRWELDIRPYSVQQGDENISEESIPLELYRVALTVRWGGTAQPREATFETLRAVPRDRREGGRSERGRSRTGSGGRGR